MFQVTILAFLLSQPPSVPDGPPRVPDGPPEVKELPTPTGNHVVFVNTDKRTVGSYQTIRNDNLDLPTGIYLVVNNGWHRVNVGFDPLVAITTLEREASRSAIPFVKRRGELQRTVDDDRNDPRFAVILQGMVPYETATKTQTTFRRVVGFIRPEARSVVLNKWNVPGHLDGVSGWSSRLYKNASAQVFLTRQDPLDSVSAVTWSRSYPNDTWFADVLRGPTGEVFEVRMAHKTDNSWQRFVAFSNATAKPIGYIRPSSKDCRDCHKESGVSAYGGSAIPGGDSIFSDPFDLLEAGRVVQGGNGTQL